MASNPDRGEAVETTQNETAENEKRISTIRPCRLYYCFIVEHVLGRFTSDSGLCGAGQLRTAL